MLIAANWKMNGSAAFVREWLAEWDKARTLVTLDHAAEVVVCPPAPFLGMIPNPEQRGFALGGQDCSAENSGARTGEISANMLAEFGCRFVLVGHSERREFWKEDGKICGAKMKTAIAAGLTPILCVGETAEERKQGKTKSAVKTQLGAALAEFPTGEISSKFRMVVGYEPVWAIGGGGIPSPSEISEAHGAVRDFFSSEGFNRGKCDIIPVIYGGSVNASNAAEIFAAEGVDGALVGGASLRADEFARICQAVEAQNQTRTETKPKQ